MSGDYLVQTKYLGTLRFHRIPNNKTFVVSRAVVVDGRIYMLGRDDRIYSDTYSSTGFYTSVRAAKEISILKAMRLLRRVSDEDYQKFRKLLVEAEKNEADARAARSFEIDAKDAGIKLTASQKRILERAKAKAPGIF
jgi:hypothetical protein